MNIHKNARLTPIGRSPSADCSGGEVARFSIHEGTPLWALARIANLIEDTTLYDI